MQQISEADLSNLSLDELVTRMDDFISLSFAERNAHLPKGFPQKINLVSQLMATKLVTSKDLDHKRKIAFLCFSYLTQQDLGQVSLGIQNHVLYGKGFTEDYWKSPIFRLKHAALTQYGIISSRMAFEVFIDLLYAIENGKRINSKKSKLKAFRNWLFDISNPFHYFAHLVVGVYLFDRDQRTPEVHGASKFPTKFLTLEVPSSDERNMPLALTNALLNSWISLLDILNEKRPNSMFIPLGKDDWFKAFMSQDEILIKKQLLKMFDEIN